MGQATRVFYAVVEPAFAQMGSAGSGYVAAHGVQNVQLNTSFDLEQVFELGQIEIYDNVETVPNVAITVEKVLDSKPLIYHLATPTATGPSLNNRSIQRCDMVLSIFDDEQDSASGVPLVQAYISGCYVESLSYKIPVEGNMTESVNLVANDKSWRTSSFLFNGHFDNTDSPISGVRRRQHVQMGTTGVCSVWPTDIPNLTISGGSGYNAAVGATFQAHIQDVDISTNFNRQNLFELGKRREFFRYAKFPVEVTCSINVIATGTNPGDNINAVGDAETNLTNQPIVVRLNNGTTFDLGNKNKLKSCSFSSSVGGDATIISYQYSNFNRLNVFHPGDPGGYVY